MRVGIIALLHESNTFISEPTTIEHFRENTLLVDDEVCQMADSHHEVAGFFQGLELAESIEANSVHGSDSVENAAQEIAFFFSKLDIVG